MYQIQPRVFRLYFVLTLFSQCHIRGVVGLEQVPCDGFLVINSPDTVAPGTKSIDTKMNCTVVEGNLMVGMFSKKEIEDSMANRGLARKASAEEYRPLENLREITGFLLIYDAMFLDTIERLLPNLRIIGGEDSAYGLMVASNLHLKSIGLSNLTEISEGGVFVKHNELLCNAESIRWEKITRKSRNFALSFNNENLNNGICSPQESCDQNEQGTCLKGKNQREFACWDRKTCQTDCGFKEGCYSENGELKQCHKLCAGGCEGPRVDQCYACRHIYHNGSCHRECPKGLLAYKGRRCMTEKECKDLPGAKASINSDETQYKPLKELGTCQLQCPSGQEEYSVEEKWRCKKCIGKCPKRCSQMDVGTLNDASLLKGCEIIDRLSIYIPSAHGEQYEPDVLKVGIQLEKYLSSLTEITKTLEITYTPSLSTLGFLRNLKIIRGVGATKDDYTLSVIGNANLARLFPGHPVQIYAGKVRFSNNPKLCPDLIMETAENMGRAISNERANSDDISEMEIMKRSNGDKAICTQEKLVLNAHVFVTNNVLLSWDKFDTNFKIDHRTFLGYQLFLKEVKEGEIPDMFSNRDACSDSWSMLVKSADDSGTLLSELEPNTKYAVYIQTATIITNNERTGAISDIIQFETFFSQPSEPRLFPISDKDVTSHSILIRWEPPEKPNGEIAYYEITFNRLLHTVEESDTCSKTARPPSLDMAEKDKNKTESMERKGKSEGACREKGCCKCPSKSGTTINSNHEGDISIEDWIINTMVSKAFSELERSEVSRKKRSIDSVPRPLKVGYNSDPPNSTDEFLEGTGTTLSYSNNTYNSSTPSYDENEDLEVQTIIVPALENNLSILLQNLSHYALYEIGIAACHENATKDATVESKEEGATKEEMRFCSKNKKVVQTTKAIPDNDKIPEKPTREYIVKRSSTRVEWKSPPNPNGKILSYHVEIKNVQEKDAKPVYQCVKGVSYDVSKGPGNYSIRIKARSIAGFGPYTDPIYIIVESPALLTRTQKILMGIFIPLFLIAAGIILLVLFQKFGPQKIPVISINGDYIPLYVADEWELKRELIELVDKIGSGGFGVVYRGTGIDLQSPRGDKFGPCAVKTVKPESSDHERLMFLFEATIMKRFSTAFIVKLYGVVSEGQPALMVMELMENGNLKEYLRSRRPGAEENLTDAPPPNKEETLRWSVQIADGMAYLESKKFIHRDLAARNCMMTATGICKIGDFGMTRDVYTTDYYRPEGRRMMPVRWMSPEALRDAKFTSRSDVFSFGVVLWEIVTLAQQPYQGLGNEDIFPYVVEQKRVMDKPLGCPQRFYDLMLQCWKYESRERITFAELVFELLKDIKHAEDFKEAPLRRRMRYGQKTSMYLQTKNFYALKMLTDAM